MNDGVPTITGGVGTRKGRHVAAALDDAGHLLGIRSFSTSTAGCRNLLAWLRGFGDVVAVGVEATGSRGAGLSNYLNAQNVRVLEVNRPYRERGLRRRSNRAGAEAAARAVLSAPAGHHSWGMIRPPNTSPGRRASHMGQTRPHDAIGRAGARTDNRIRARLLDEAEHVLPGGIIRAHPITLLGDLMITVVGTTLLLTPNDPRTTLALSGFAIAGLRAAREARAGLHVPRRWKDHAGTAVYVASAPVLLALASDWHPLAVRALTCLYLLTYLAWRVVLWWADLTVITPITLTRIIRVFSDETPSIEIRHFGPKTVRRSLLGRMVGYGTLHMDTPSEKDAVLGYIPNIPDPYKVKEMLTNRATPVDT